MTTQKKILWNIFSEVQPEKWGYYIVSNGSDASTIIAPYFKNNFYRKGFYHACQTDEENQNNFKNYNGINYKPSKFKYWMNVPEFPSKPEKTFEQHLGFNSKKTLELFINNNINSIEDLLSKTKEELYSIKGFKDYRFKLLLQRLFHEGYMPPKEWGNIFDLIKLNGDSGCIDLFKIIFDTEIINFENFNDFEDKSTRNYKGGSSYPSSNTWIELILFENYDESNGNKDAMNLNGFIKRKPCKWCNGRLTKYLYEIDSKTLQKLNDFYISIGYLDYINKYPFSITTNKDNL